MAIHAEGFFSPYQRCNVDRNAGAKGRCGESAVLRISSMGPHFGEEPPISGTKGSGTIFFTGCALGCFFCQNHQISRKGLGENYEEEEFLVAVLALVRHGVHNINYVTPDHFWPHVRHLISGLRRHALSLPQLINGSGYHTLDSVREMAEYTDIFLPDYKFADPGLAKYCADAEEYPEIALQAIECMVEQKGFLNSWPVEEGALSPPATKGVLVRHLILPGHIENSLLALTTLRERLGAYLPLSLMSQYHPNACCAGRGHFQRPITQEEFDRVFDKAMDLGFKNLFYQDPGVGAAFVPDFREAEPFEGNRVRP